MQVNYHYKTPSQVKHASAASEMTFSPDTLREPTFFVGELKQNLAFREAMTALHQVVISDMRFKPKDKSAYFDWLQTFEQQLLADYLAQSDDIKSQVDEIKQRLSGINQQKQAVFAEFYQAQNRYFKYLYKHDIDAWYVLDPVISIHPDQVFFECFSEDESSYGKLSCNYEVFDHIDEKSFGTTNIDYSETLYQKFQQIREYRKTRLNIDPKGFDIKTQGFEAYHEKKIDLPDSWVRGFLQVSSAMTLPMVQLNLQPMDIHNLIYQLKRHKERQGPRAMRFELTPDAPVKVYFEPWNHHIVLPRTIYQGNEARSIRVWGRRRLMILESLIPIAKGFTLQLLGDGLPSFYIADLGDMSFTLGLSGWSANDWSTMGQFDLLAPKAEVDSDTLAKVYQQLSQQWCVSSFDLAKRLNLSETLIKSALTLLAQHGQVLFDGEKNLYRFRKIIREDIDFDALRFSNPREKQAQNFIKANLVTDVKKTNQGLHQAISAKVLDNGQSFAISITLDNEQRLMNGRCQCHFFHHNGLKQGPCAHMLAVRMMESKQ